MKLERYITSDYLESQKQLHQRPKGYGGSGDKWAPAVSNMILLRNCHAVLDYGCGQGTLKKAIDKIRIRNADGPVEISEYDPAVEGKDSIEKYAMFDLVVCTDVLEHVEPDRLGVVIDHIFRLSKKLVFLVIATRPSNKWFPDGRNVHLTIEPASWWRERILHPSFKEIEAPPSPDQKPSREFVALLERLP